MAEPIPMSLWGKDHWSTFAYVETCVVDSKGYPDKERMRCDPSIHPAHSNKANQMFRNDPAKPTMLKGFDSKDPTQNVAREHDDWSCLEDAEAAGLIKLEGTGMFPRVVLTTAGKAVAARLREHKAAGGMFATFNP